MTLWLVAAGSFGDFRRAIDGSALYLLLLSATAAIGMAQTRLQLKILCSIILVVVLAIDLSFIHFFRTTYFAIWRHLPVQAGALDLVTVAGYAQSYLTLGVLLGSLAGGFAFLLVFLRGFLPFVARIIFASIFVSASVYVVARSLTAPNALWQALPPSTGKEVAKPLYTVARTQSIKLQSSPVYAPRTIIFVIMESTGRSIPSSSGEGYLRTKLINLSESSNWLDFRNAVTNSNATDVSIPSMLTGTGADESFSKLSSMPFVFDLAAARGYKTSFVTSSTLKWANFESFFRGASIDQLITAETFGAPFINDITVDDHLAYSAASAVVRKTDAPLFLGLYVNALHWPFQTESKGGIPSNIINRRSRAAYVHERGFDQLFSALRETDRLSDALIIVVGDHGEFDFSDRSVTPLMRVETFTNGILSPIYLMKLPDRLPSKAKKAAFENIDKLVASLDFAPSIAELLGLSLDGGLEYGGKSLFGPIAEDRIVLSTATNEWRSWVKGAVAVSQGRDRLLCEPSLSCRRYISLQGDLVYLREADMGDVLLRHALESPIMQAAVRLSITPH